MIVGIAVETTVDSNDASAVTRRSAKVTARLRRGSKRGGGDIGEQRSRERRTPMLDFPLAPRASTGRFARVAAPAGSKEPECS